MRTRRLFRIAVVCIMLTCVKTSQSGCTSCESGTYSEIIGATSNTCLQCAGNSTSAAASSSPDDCMCISGFWAFRNGSNLVCVHSNLPNSGIIHFQFFIEKSVNFSVPLVKSVIANFANNLNIIDEVHFVQDVASDTDTFDIRLLVPNTTTAALRLSDVYRLLLMQYQGTDNAFVIAVDGTMSLRKTLPHLALGDRMFTYQNKARPINPLIFTKTTQTTDETQFRALSPKNSRFDVPPASIFVVRSACTDLSCECQPNTQDYCDSNLRTLTRRNDSRIN